MDDARLPPAEHSGTEGHWTITDQRGETADLHGTFLGMGSSHRPQHKHRGTYAPPGTHCSTCRWTWSRTCRTSSMGRPAGSVRSQSRYRLPG